MDEFKVLAVDDVEITAKVLDTGRHHTPALVDLALKITKGDKERTVVTVRMDEDTFLKLRDTNSDADVKFFNENKRRFGEHRLGS